MAEKLVNFFMDEELKHELDVLSKRERRTIKQILNDLAGKYVKEHGDGNPNFELTQWVDNSDMQATPAFMRTMDDWVHFLDNIDEKRFREIEAQGTALYNKINKRWEQGFD